MQYTIQNGILEVRIDELGAEIVSVKKNGEERLWQNPTGEWAGHAPLLFPVCGHFGLTKDGVSYPIKAHGFAKKAMFALTAQTKDSISFAIASNEQTRVGYPYEFVFTVTYSLVGERLVIAYTVANPDDQPLYFACGGHDAFALEKNVGEYELAFEKETRLVHYYHDEEGYLNGETKDFGYVKTFTLPEDILQDGATVIFKSVSADMVTLREKNGKAIARVGFAEYENLLLWRSGEAKYICIEPWTNLPDYVNVPDKEFSQKEGVIEVAPKSEKTITRYIEFL